MIKIARVNNINYVERQVPTGVFRDWYLIPYIDDKKNGYNLSLKVYIPMKFVGKKIRIKIEEVEEDSEPMTAYNKPNYSKEK